MNLNIIKKIIRNEINNILKESKNIYSNFNCSVNPQFLNDELLLETIEETKKIKKNNFKIFKNIIEIENKKLLNDNIKNYFMNNKDFISDIIFTILHERNDLRKEEYLSDLVNKNNPISGHCMIASEVFYYLVGGHTSPYTPVVYNFGNKQTHWYLATHPSKNTKSDKNEIIDITKKQFHLSHESEEEFEDKMKDIYSQHTMSGFKGFMTKEPSIRSKIVLYIIKKYLEKNKFLF